MYHTKNYNALGGLLLLSVLHMANGSSLVGITPLRTDYIISTMDFLTTTITSAITYAVSVWDLQSPPGCGKMGLEARWGLKRQNGR